MGIGGTGSLLADGLSRLLTGYEHIELLLIDHDRVEPHNLLRQAFHLGDVGKFKSQVIAERLSRQYGRRIGYSVLPFDEESLDTRMGAGMVSKGMHTIIIGCVDNAAARRSIARVFERNWDNWWIDAGNSYNSGQVLIGNHSIKDNMIRCFHKADQTVDKLPLPSLQLPSLLVPPTKPARARQDCAEAVESNLQSPVINQAMATLTLEFVYRLLTNNLTWMGAYLNLEAGTLQTVPAEPVTVARMLSMRVDELTDYGYDMCNRYQMSRRR